MTDKIKICCEDMEFTRNTLNLIEVYPGDYSAELQCYSCKNNNKQGGFLINHCPFCGKKVEMENEKS